MYEKFNDRARYADPCGAGDPNEPNPPHSELVAGCDIHAHQSRFGGDHVLNVQVNCPPGVTVKLTVNDDIVLCEEFD